MFGAIAFAYGLLTSFVLSGASRNNKLKRPHPPILVYAGYICCGISTGVSGLLFLHAARHYLGG